MDIYLNKFKIGSQQNEILAMEPKDMKAKVSVINYKDSKEIKLD